MGHKKKIGTETGTEGEPEMTDQGEPQSQPGEGEEPFAGQEQLGEEPAQSQGDASDTQPAPGDDIWAAPPRDADFSALEAQNDAGLAEAKLEAADNRDKYLRALAELENYKKRSLKERSELLKYQGEKILFDMVEILDNFEWALQHADADAAQFKSGVELIHRKFLDMLGKWQVRGEASVGQPFDPAKHHALSKINVYDAVPGTIINELKKAYYYKDKLLRAGEVVVADQPAAAAGDLGSQGSGVEQGESSACESKTQPSTEDSEKIDNNGKDGGSESGEGRV
jgi:molecular chaperone GrpE